VYAARIYAQIIGVVLILVGVVGCGASGGGDGAEDGKAPSDAKDSVVKTIQVKETEFTLNPSEITLDKPGTYVFKAVNPGNTAHALEVEGQGIEEETEEIQPGQDAELKVKLAAGTYELYCPVDGHKEEGMEGKVIVKEGSGGSDGY
jgi:plastocyanin